MKKVFVENTIAIVYAIAIWKNAFLFPFFKEHQPVANQANLNCPATEHQQNQENRFDAEEKEVCNNVLMQWKERFKFTKRVVTIRLVQQCDHQKKQCDHQKKSSKKK